MDMPRELVASVELGHHEPAVTKVSVDIVRNGHYYFFLRTTEVGSRSQCKEVELGMKDDVEKTIKALWDSITEDGSKFCSECGKLETESSKVKIGGQDGRLLCRECWMVEGLTK